MRQLISKLGCRSCGTQVSAALLTVVVVCGGLAAIVAAPKGVAAAPITVEQLVISTAAEKNVGDPAALEEASKELNAQNPDLEKALELLKAAVEKDPRLPPARVLLAKAMLVRGSVPAAQAQLELLAKESVEEPETYLLLGEMAFGFRRVTEAKLLFDEGGRKMSGYSGNPDRQKNLNERVEAGLASVAEAREDWDTAIKHIEGWIKVNADSHAAHQRLGAVLFRRNPKDKDAHKAAFAEFEKAFALNKEISPPGVMMMQLFEQDGDRTKAADWAKFAISKAPENLRAQLEVAQWQINAGKFSEAKQHAERAIQLDADSLEAMVLRGIVARYLRELDDAEQYLDSARLKEPNSFVANDQLALTLIESKDPAKKNRSQNLAQSNFERNQQSPEAQWTFAWVLFKNGRTREAGELIQRAAPATRQLTPDMLFYLAEWFVERGEKEQASKALDEALKNEGPFYYRKEAQSRRDGLASK